MLTTHETETTHTEPEPESGFLNALRRGDAEAYERLVQENRNRLVAAAFRIVGNREDAMDVVQEAFLAAYQAIHRFRGGSKTSTWLYRITVNAALMHLRKRKTRPERDLDESVQEQMLATEDRSIGTPEEVLNANELLARLDERFRRLPRSARAVFVLRDFQEKSTAQTARVLGISENAVKIRLHRARRDLRTGPNASTLGRTA